MKPKLLILVATPLLLISFSSCENPADKTADAEVGEAAPVASATGGSTYQFTENSTIEFTGSKVTGSQSGGFKNFEGTFSVKDGEPTSGEFTIDMDSTFSENPKLTAHLKDADFFDVPQYPETKFAVTTFTKTSDKNYDLSGNLTLHGITKNITFPTKVDVSEERIKVSAEFDIKRTDFGIIYPGKKDDLIRDEVIIKFELEAKPAS